MYDPERFFDCGYAERFTRSELTVLDNKASAYAGETAYREVLYETALRLGSERAVADLIKRTGIGLFRPDAIAHAKVGAALSYFERLGIRPVHAVDAEVGYRAVREIWRYQLNSSSGQRLRLLDLLFGACPSLLAFFTVDVDKPRIPCTVLMADSKGPADVSERQGWELRSYLDSPNRIEVYVHCGDEPADVVRDGGLLIGPAAFAEALTHPPERDAVNMITARAGELAATPGIDEPVVIDPLLRSVIDDAPADGRLGRWRLLRCAANTCRMVACSAESLIAESGIRSWWEQADLLDDREKYFIAATGWAGSRLADPLP